jgi:hypothetical protein
MYNINPLYFGVYNLINFISFLTIFIVPNAPIGGFQILFKHQK